MADARRILVVDDSRDIRELLSEGLRSAGYEVHTASDGEEALLIAEAMPPSLLILDIMMPKKSGWELLRELRQHPRLRDLKVIVLTAIGANIGQATSALHGADAHIDKPFAFSALLAEVKGLIG